MRVVVDRRWVGPSISTKSRRGDVDLSVVRDTRETLAISIDGRPEACAMQLPPLSARQF